MFIDISEIRLNDIPSTSHHCLFDLFPCIAINVTLKRQNEFCHKIKDPQAVTGYWLCIGMIFFGYHNCY